MGTHCIYRWKGHQQDVVEQMLVGLGWRITGYCDAADTRTVAITSRDAAGVRFIITAHKDRVGDGWCCVGGTSVDICHKQEVHIDIKTCVSKTHSYSTISISLILCMYTDNIYIYIYQLCIVWPCVQGCGPIFSHDLVTCDHSRSWRWGISQKNPLRSVRNRHRRYANLLG